MVPQSPTCDSAKETTPPVLLKLVRVTSFWYPGTSHLSNTTCCPCNSCTSRAHFRCAAHVFLSSVARHNAAQHRKRALCSASAQSQCLPSSREDTRQQRQRSEEHTSELQSLLRIS